MKLQALIILTLSIFQICHSQIADTVRIYDHLKPADRWKLKIDSKKFVLYTNNLFKKDEITTTGQFNVSDTTIQFLCDTSKLKNKILAKNSLKQFSNIPFILTGEIFRRRNNYFVPHNINYEPDQCATIPTGVFARYYRGDGYGSNIIELKQDKTYILIDNSCVAHFTEKGTWTLNNDIITFVTDEGKRSMLEWVTEDMKLYLTENYLIGKKTKKNYTKTRKTIVTETYSYMSKLPFNE